MGQVLGLANALLPSVPDATVAAMSDPPVCVLNTKVSGSQKDDDDVRMASLNANPKIMQTYSNDLLDQLLMVTGSPTPFHSLEHIVWRCCQCGLGSAPLISLTHSERVLMFCLPQIYGGSAAPSVRQVALSIIIKVLRFAPPDVLSVVLQDLPISSFIASLLSTNDPATAASGLLMAEILMTKLPELLTP
jgi:hypothetical protein